MNKLVQQGYIFGAIFVLANHLQTLGDAFDKETTLKQWLFLASITKFEEPPTVNMIANYIGYSRQNAKRIANALEDQGFVNINRDENDARSLRISLTPKCETYFQMRQSKETKFMEALFSDFGTQQIKGLYQGLVKLSENTKKMEEHYEIVKE